jgi:hypothetical protein
MHTSAPPAVAQATPRLTRREIHCAHCNALLGICYGERVFAVGSMHFVKLVMGQCAACCFQIHWAPSEKVLLEGPTAVAVAFDNV